MLGYVKVYKPELKIKDYELYRGIYCSLCKALGKQYGVLSRLMLSYDVTFVLVILFAAANVSPSFKPGRCPFNPSKKCNYCQNGSDFFSFAAAVTILLFYYKVRDDIADSPFFKKCLMYLVLPYAALKRKKALKAYSDLDKIISENMKVQSLTEKKGSSSIDEACHASADSLGKIFDYYSEKKTSLYNLGYFIGRYVYLIDAADDLEKDLKSGGYNVFVNKFSLKKGDAPSEEMKEEIRSVLNQTLACAAREYEKMEQNNLDPITENVIYDSMTMTINTVLKGKSAK